MRHTSSTGHLPECFSDGGECKFGDRRDSSASGLRPPVSLSSMTASTTSAKTPGQSSSRTDETSGTVVEGSTVFNVESSMGDTSIVEIYSTQFTVTMPPDVSTVTFKFRCSLYFSFDRHLTRI